MKVALLTNGPGELWGWVRPVIAELRKRGHSLSLWLLPCQYASGNERAVASGLGADKLEGPYGSALMWRAIAQEKTDCVLQLGGDLIFGRRMAGRAGAPLLCYAYGFKKGMEHARVFTAYSGMAGAIDAKLGKNRAQVIGDLVKDSLAAVSGVAGTSLQRDEGPRLLLFPGSRPAIRNLCLKWLVNTTGYLKALVPDVRLTTLFSPFAQESEFRAWESAGFNPVRSETAVAMKEADYAFTQPGTNTLEMMHCGLPALVAAPMDFLDVMPVGGLVKLALGVPLAGHALKKWKLTRTLEKNGGFISWPNRLAGRAVLDEAVGDVTPRSLAELVAASLMDKKKLSRVREELLELSGAGDAALGGAASRLCDAVESA